MHVFLEPKGNQLLVRAINAIVFAPTSQIKIQAMCCWRLQPGRMAACHSGQLLYSRSVALQHIMLYVSPPPCPFQSALGGCCSWLGLHLLCRLQSNLIGILRLLPFHCIPAAYACSSPMPLLVKPKSNSTMAKWSTTTSARLMMCERDESFQTFSWSQLSSGKSRHRTAITLRRNAKFRNSPAAPWRWRS